MIKYWLYLIIYVIMLPWPYIYCVWPTHSRLTIHGSRFTSSAEASNGPNADARINHKVTKYSSVILIWVHTNNGTISLQVRTSTWAHLLSHSQYLRENVNFKRKSTLVIMSYKTETREIQETHPRTNLKVIKSPSAIPTWVLSKIGTTPPE